MLCTAAWYLVWMLIVRPDAPCSLISCCDDCRRDYFTPELDALFDRTFAEQMEGVSVDFDFGNTRNWVSGVGGAGGADSA